VYLDSGSTTDAVASALVDRHELEGVLVVTNSLTVALTLEPAIPRIEVIVTGGSLRPLQHSLVNPFAAPMIESLHVDVAFIGCTGVDAARGVSNVNVAEAEIKALLLARATESVLVADSTKIGRVDRAHVGTIDSFASIVTAGVIDGPRLAELRGTGVAIVRADA
jgi:DeoR family transcriptional regulator of aga operon